MKTLFLGLVAAMISRKISAAALAVHQHRVAALAAEAEAAGLVDALLATALTTEGAGAEAAWWEWEVAWQAAEEAKEAAAEEGRRLEAEEDRLRLEYIKILRKIKHPTRRRTKGAAIKAAREGLETAIEVLGGSCGGSIIYEEAAEALKEESISILRRLLPPEEAAKLLEEYFDLED